jgi:peptidoglycan hydrolase-like protein with peptidoglycan-binding domain
MMQGYQPSEPGNPQRNRRTKRYDLTEEQGKEPISDDTVPYAGEQTGAPHFTRNQPPYNDGFTQRERTVYTPQYPSSANNMRNTSTSFVLPTVRKKTSHLKRFVGWAAALTAIVLIGILGNEYISAIRPDSADSNVSTAAPTEVATTVQAMAAVTIASAYAPTSAPTATKVPYVSLAKGASGEPVKQLQLRLIALGYLSDVADGMFGGKTYTAVSDFQSQNNLPSTGVADSQTLDLIYSGNAATASYTAVTANTSSDTNTSSSSLSSMTTSQWNALETAQDYLEFMAFSYQGLIEQLEYERYTHKDAVYAADHCGADWYDQALQKAGSYLDCTAFSYEGLIDQLEYEDFTSKQATYAADHCGANWNEQAASCAKNYLSIMSFSRNELIEQLEYEGFTHKQAVYGAKENGY